MSRVLISPKPVDKHGNRVPGVTFSVHEDGPWYTGAPGSYAIPSAGAVSPAVNLYDAPTAGTAVTSFLSDADGYAGSMYFDPPANANTSYVIVGQLGTRVHIEPVAIAAAQAIAATDQFGNSLASLTDPTKIIVPLPGPSIEVSSIAFDDPEAPTATEVAQYIAGLAKTNRAQNQRYHYLSEGGVYGAWGYNVNGTVYDACCGGSGGGVVDTGSGAVAIAAATYQCFDNNTTPDITFMGHWTSNFTSIKESSGAAYSGDVRVRLLKTATGVEIYNSGLVPIGTDLSTVGTGGAAAHIKTGSTVSQGGQIHIDKMAYALANSEYYADHAIGLPVRTVSAALPEEWTIELTAGTETGTAIIKSLWWNSLDNATQLKAGNPPYANLSRFEPNTPANTRYSYDLDAFDPRVGGLYSWEFLPDPAPWPFATTAPAGALAEAQMFRNRITDWQYVFGSDIKAAGPSITAATWVKNGVTETEALATPVGVYDFIRSKMLVEANVISTEGVDRVDRDAAWLQLRSCAPGDRFGQFWSFDVAAFDQMVAGKVTLRSPVLIGF